MAIDTNCPWEERYQGASVAYIGEWRNSKTERDKIMRALGQAGAGAAMIAGASDPEYVEERKVIEVDFDQGRRINYNDEL